jgi:hypothetical protein
MLHAKTASYAFPSVILSTAKKKNVGCDGSNAYCKYNATKNIQIDK